MCFLELEKKNQTSDNLHNALCFLSLEGLFNLIILTKSSVVPAVGAAGWLLQVPERTAAPQNKENEN